MKVINAYAGELYRIMKSFDYPMDSPKELLQVSATDDEATLVAHLLRPNFNGRASVVLWSFHRGDSLEHLKEGCMSGVFPIGTLTVNVLGCFLFGCLAPLLADRAQVPLVLRTAVLTGFLGAFTTFSAFSFDSLELMRSGHTLKAVANVALSLVLAILAMALGLRLGQRWS